MANRGGGGAPLATACGSSFAAYARRRSLKAALFPRGTEEHARAERLCAFFGSHGTETRLHGRALETRGKKRPAPARSASSFFLSFFLFSRCTPGNFSTFTPPHPSSLSHLSSLFFFSFYQTLQQQQQKPAAPPSSRSSSSGASSPRSSSARPGAPSSSPSSPPRRPRPRAPSRSGSGTRACGTAGGATSGSGPRCRRSRTSTRAGGTSSCRRRTASSPWGELGFFFSFFFWLHHLGPQFFLNLRFEEKKKERDKNSLFSFPFLSRPRLSLSFSLFLSLPF